MKVIVAPNFPSSVTERENNNTESRIQTNTIKLKFCYNAKTRKYETGLDDLVTNIYNVKTVSSAFKHLVEKAEISKQTFYEIKFGLNPGDLTSEYIRSKKTIISSYEYSTNLVAKILDSETSLEDCLAYYCVVNNPDVAKNKQVAQDSHFFYLTTELSSTDQAKAISIKNESITKLNNFITKSEEEIVQKVAVILKVSYTGKETKAKLNEQLNLWLDNQIKGKSDLSFFNKIIDLATSDMPTNVLLQSYYWVTLAMAADKRYIVKNQAEYIWTKHSPENEPVTLGNTLEDVVAFFVAPKNISLFKKLVTALS